MNYYGNLDWFSEMGSEGPSLIFVDEKAKYLSGYEQLDLSYFFKNLDQFLMVVTLDGENVYQQNTNFVYNSKIQAILPQGVNLKALKEWIDKKALVCISTTKQLYADKIILKSSGLEKEFLLANISKLLKTPNNKIPKNLLVIKQEFKIVIKCLKEFSKNDKNHQKNWVFEVFITTPQSFLFGSTPIEVILRGDGEHLVSWLQERANLKK